MINIPQEVKDILHSSRSTRKNFRVHFPNGERADITNSNLIEESVEFTESLCSQDEIKFGLCESSVLKFKTFDVENIKGCEITAQMEIIGNLIYDYTIYNHEISAPVTMLGGSDKYFVFDEPISGSMELEIVYRDSDRTHQIFEFENFTDKKMFKFLPEKDTEGFFLTLTNSDYSGNVHLVELASVSTTQNNDFVFWSIPYGRFIVDECKKEADMRTRTVVAYTDYVNAKEVVSPFELAKLNCTFQNNVKHEYNPVNYALSSLSQQVLIDASILGLFDGIHTLKGKLTEFNGTHGFGGSIASKVSVGFNYYCLRLDLNEYKAWPYLIAYKNGKRITNPNVIVDKLWEYVDKYRSALKYTSEIAVQTSLIDKAIGCSKPFGRINFYSKPWKRYDTNEIYGLLDNGFIDPKFTNYSGGIYELCLPYKMDLYVREYNPATHAWTILETVTYNIFNKNDIDVVDLYLGQNESGLYLPSISKQLDRIKNSTGEYVVGLDNMPSGIDLVTAFAELNGRFLKQDRITGLYSFVALEGGNVLYPREDLYPSEDLYPGENTIQLTTNDYYTAWYDDYMIKPYSSIRADYKNTSDEEVSIEVFNEKVVKDYEVVATTTARYSSPMARFEVPIPMVENGMLTNLYSDYLITGAWIDNGAVVEEVEIPNPTHSVEFTLTKWNTSNAYFYVSLDTSSGPAEGEVIMSLVHESVTDASNYYKTMDLSENFIVSNYNISEEEMSNMLNNMLPEINGVAYMPATIDAKGLPYIEPGDPISVITRDGIGFDTIILRRTVSGIHALRDNFESN